MQRRWKSGRRRRRGRWRRLSAAAKPANGIMTGLASALTVTASGEETHRCILTKERASAGRKRRMDEIGKYRKRKKQKSKSENRSDHKHEYERTILMRVNSVNNHIDGYSWSTHCKICGRLGKNDVLHDDDFRKPEWKGKSRWWSADMYLSFEEIRKKYPDVPVYRMDPHDWKMGIRVR